MLDMASHTNDQILKQMINISFVANSIESLNSPFKELSHADGHTMAFVRKNNGEKLCI